MADAPPSVLRVVNASRVLDASSKLLLGEIFHLDRSYKGCYARQTTLACRVGRSVDAMKACRTKLRETGFLERSEERLSNDRRQYTWFFILPEQYWPSEHAKDDEIFELADRLDEDLRSGKLREQAQDNRKALDAIKGGVLNAFDLELAKAKEREKQGASTPPIKEKQVASTPPIQKEIGGADTPLSQKQVASTPAIGGVDADNRGRPHPHIGGVDAPPSKSTDKDRIEPISTEGPQRTERSQSDLHEENGTIEPDPNTEPRTQSPECPHPQGSPEWKHWHLTHLRAPAVAS